MCKTIHVRKVSANEAAKQTGLQPESIMRMAGGISAPVYVRCNKNGRINWNVGEVWPAEQLIERNKVKIIK